MIKGKNVILRPITIDDTDMIVRWRNSPDVRDNFVYRDVLTKEAHMDYYKQNIETGKVKQFIIITADTNTPIGSVYLRDIDQINSKAEFGIFIGEKTQCGKGYGKEATFLICSYGFKTLDLHKIMLRVFPYNTAAVKTYEKIGFKQEAYLKDELKINGSYYDMIYMALFEQYIYIYI